MIYVWYHVEILLSCPDNLRKITLKRKLILMLCELLTLSKMSFVKRNFFESLNNFNQDNTSHLTGLLAWAECEAQKI